MAKKIVQRAQDFGIKPCDIVVDPLVMPIGAMATAGQQVFSLVRKLREELGVNTTCGASNISFGLPDRKYVNSTFIALVISIVLMFFIHQLQLFQERLVLDSEAYCNDNLIARLRIKPLP